MYTMKTLTSLIKLIRCKLFYGKVTAEAGAAICETCNHLQITKHIANSLKCWQTKQKPMPTTRFSIQVQSSSL